MLTAEKPISAIGYAGALSVVPGERVDFMVSAEVPTYEATIVRLNGPVDATGPNSAEKVVISPSNGTYSGRHQAVHCGSYLVLDDTSMRSLESFTLQTWIYPTTPIKSEPQGLLARWSVRDSTGFKLLISRDGDLVIRIATSDGTPLEVRSRVPLERDCWYFIACTYDRGSGEVCLLQERLTRNGILAPTVHVKEHSAPGGLTDSGTLLLVAAGEMAQDAAGKPFARELYNGKIENPRIYGCALGLDDLELLKRGGRLQDLEEHLLVAADFASDTFAAQVLENRTGQPLGRLINAPTRAVTGHNWSGTQVDYKLASDEYGAIHFHDDDLEDAGWEADFQFPVPAQLPSGVYAARLTANDRSTYVPFFVRPATGCPTSDIVFLAPTNTYLAYANDRLYASPGFSDLMEGRLDLSEEDEYIRSHPELGSSLYDLHSDGSGCTFSSWLRPILNFSPSYRHYIQALGLRHFPADLNLIDWMEEKGLQHDVVTDQDVHLEGAELLTPYKVVVTGTHPEYWTTPMIAALEAYLGGGGKLMYLGGNGFYWVTGMDNDRTHLIEVRRGHAGTRTWESPPGEAYLSTTGEPGGLWRHRGKAPQKLVGVGFAANGGGRGEGYIRLPDSFDTKASFIFAGVGDREVIGNFGMILGGAAGDEIDRVDYNLGTPQNVLRLATSSGRHTDFYQLAIEDLLVTAPGQGGSENPKVRADMVYFETVGGGAVFSVGSMNWCGSLSHNNYRNNVSTITHNVIQHFLS